MNEAKKKKRKRFNEMAKIIKPILSTESTMIDADAAKIKALLIIYDFQTPEERNRGQTVEDNNMGFTAYDGDILTSFVEQLKDSNTLSRKQMQIVRNRIKKYWRQITQVSIDKSTPAWIDEYIEVWKFKNSNRYSDIYGFQY